MRNNNSPFNKCHDLKTSYNNELEPMTCGDWHLVELEDGTLVNQGAIILTVDQEILREAIANDGWDYEDYIKGPEQLPEEIAWWDFQDDTE